MKIKAIKTRIFLPNENLRLFIDQHIKTIKDGDILVVTSKIAALSEGRFMAKWDKNKKQEIIRRESELMIPAKHICLTVKDGMVMASAGIDESNGNGLLIFLPRDSWKIASALRRYFMSKYQLKRLGVIITDSRNAPFRSGASGVAIAYSGFKGLKDYRKKVDIFGRLFHSSRVDVADSLAAAAVLCMGEGSERRPLAIISSPPVEYINRVNRRELRVKVEEDMYAPLFQAINSGNFDKGKTTH